MIESSEKQNLFVAFITWHYNTGLKELTRAFRNFLSFGIHYFPIKELSKTIFSHWRRSSDSYGEGLDVGVWAKAFLGNMISRILGAIIRLVIIAVGIVFEITLFFVGSAIILIWVLLPIIITLGFFAGIGLLFGL
jgi:ABC-type transport system involved in cytochrome bd biosynthesis fused ATPase/permease subunit